MNSPSTPTPRLPPLDPPPRAVTLRSVLIGLAGVCFVCGLAPYNDFAMENTFLIGNFLPIGLLLIVLLLVLGVNVPLRRFAPQRAIRQGELSVIVLMVLVSCAIPSSGLMRYLPAGLTGIYTGAAERPTDWGPAIDAARVPDWLLPRVDGGSAAEKGYQDVFTRFRFRAPDGDVPWAAWLRPFLTWGVLIVLLWGLLICLSLIVRKQWTENERLTFPLATVYQSLIETPAPGHALNPLFGAVGFWIAAGGVFGVHTLNALHAYYPSFPAVPLFYDFQDVLSEPPLSFATYGLKTATVSFSIVGMAFFVQTKIAFSLWAFFILWNISEMILGSAQVTMTDGMRQDQIFGALVVYALVLIYVGRRHWWMVIRHMIARRRPGESEGRYVPFAVSGWGAAVCFSGVVGWMRLAGVTVPAGIVITLMLVMMFMVVARVMAETGLFFVQINYPLMRVFYYPVLMPARPVYTTPTNFFFGGMMTELFHDLRESLAAFFQLGLRVADESIEPARRRRSVGYGLLAAVVLSLGVGYVVSWASMLKVEYTYAVTTSSDPKTPNVYGIESAIRHNVLEPQTAFNARNLPQETATPLQRPAVQIGVGAAIVAACTALRLAFSWWPLHPVAFLVLYSYSSEKAWFSIFLGWLAKVVVVRLGGASLLKRGRSVFIGLIIGEAFAAAFWLVVNLVLHARGLEYKSLLFLPG